jgi:hypothetical protein
MEMTIKTRAVEEQEEVLMDFLKNTVCFSVRVRKWGNRARCKDPKALEEYYALTNGKSSAMVNVSRPGEQATDNGNGDGKKAKAKAKRVSASKVLVDSDALKRLGSNLSTIKAQAIACAMPSFFQGGMFVVKRDNVDKVRGILGQGREDFAATWLPEFIMEYPSRKEAARATVDEGGLGPLWLESDYPAESELRKKFSITWNFFSLNVPEGLPPEVRAEEEAKLRNMWSQTTQEMRDALRVMFGELIEHAVDRLKPAGPGQKPKVFRDSLVANMDEFFKTFEDRNIMRDWKLAELVTKCREIMSGVSAESLRTDAEIKDQTRAALEQIKAVVDPMVTEIQDRAFDFTEA